MIQQSSGFLTFISAVCFALAAASGGSAETAPEPMLPIQVEHPILLKNVDPPSTRMAVTPVGFPAGSNLQYRWEQVQDVLSPVAARMDAGKSITFSATNARVTTATFPDWGVYEIRITVTDPQNHLSASRNTWVNVWDAKSHVMTDGRADPLCAAPGILPPVSVRSLAPDPGPFRHPRLLCTDAAWPDIHKRCYEGNIPGNAFRKLQRELLATFDSGSHDFGKFSETLDAYANSGLKGTPPDLTMGIAMETSNGKPDGSKAMRNLLSYQEKLRDACFAAWVSQDPSVPHAKVPEETKARFRKLAGIVAVLAHEHLRHCWNMETGVFNKEAPLYIRGLDQLGWELGNFPNLALAYDFVASWMTPGELRETRDFLFAVGAGRTTGARTVDFSSGVHKRLLRGWEQNGDFMNIDEARVLCSLAVEGEESGMSDKVVGFFTNIARPDDYEKSEDFHPCDWVHFWDHDGGRKQQGARPYSVAASWPHARKAAVDNLQRAIWWNDDWYVSPWGFTLNKEAYYGFSTLGLWPAAVAHAIRGGENQFVTGYFYQTAIHLLYCSYVGQITRKSDHYQSNVYLYDHHDGGGDYRQNHVLILKYMYPDDPLVDYIYSADAPAFESSPYIPFFMSIFGMDPGIKGRPVSLPEMAAAKSPPLTKVDPQQGTVVARSGWQEDDMELYFDDGWIPTGHMHAEKNSFSFFALGRAWAIAPGYHIVPANYQSGVMIQDPAFASDPKTEGYVGQSPSEIPAGSSYAKCFPTPPGRLLEVIEAPDKSFSLMAGDAKTAYDFSFGGDKPLADMEKPRVDHMYPGLLAEMTARIPDLKENVLRTEKLNKDYNPVQYAFRTILFVRGQRPYALIIDDIRKDGTQRNYRWTMNCINAFGPPSGTFAGTDGKAVNSSLQIAPGATTGEAILFHLIDQGDRPGLPRLLMRDVSPLAQGLHPAIKLVARDDGILSNRVFVDRNNVVEPKYRMLLFPFRTGEKPPLTTWDLDGKTLRIDLRDGTMHTISFDETNPDHRTRVSFATSSAKSPSSH